MQDLSADIKYYFAVEKGFLITNVEATLINLAPEAKHLFEVLRKLACLRHIFRFGWSASQLSSLLLLGLSGVGYTAARIVGEIASTWCGAGRLGYLPVVQHYLGVTIVAHAGVAIGLALQVRGALPEYAEIVSAVILGSVLINEVVGPVMTKFAIARAGKAREQHKGAFEAI